MSNPVFPVTGAQTGIGRDTVNSGNGLMTCAKRRKVSLP
ncbi:MAG: hypothetical protein QOJ58_5342 [Alphaproteobacteria bacterium]|nr:hypothetical protein [Alphaproteobacteria bacterium]